MSRRELDWDLEPVQEVYYAVWAMQTRIESIFMAHMYGARGLLTPICVRLTIRCYYLVHSPVDYKSAPCWSITCSCSKYDRSNVASRHKGAQTQRGEGGAATNWNKGIVPSRNWTVEALAECWQLDSMWRGAVRRAMQPLFSVVHSFRWSNVECHVECQILNVAWSAISSPA